MLETARFFADINSGYLRYNGINQMPGFSMQSRSTTTKERVAVYKDQFRELVNDRVDPSADSVELVTVALALEELGGEMRRKAADLYSPDKV